MNFKDKNGKEIKNGTELNVPLDIFSTGIVILDDENQLSLELKYESKKLPLKDFEKFTDWFEVVN